MAMFGNDTENEIVAEPLSNGVRLMLPRRKLGWRRHWGWLLIGTSVAIMVFAFGWGIWQIQTMVIPEDRDGWDLILNIPAAFLLTLVAPALLGILFGLTMVADRTQCTIEVTGKLFIVREKLLVGRWRKRLLLKSIHRVWIGPARMYTNAPLQADQIDSATLDELGDKALLAAFSQYKDKKPARFAVGYPRELLVQLVEKLTHQLALNAQQQTLRSGGDGKSVADASVAPLDAPVENNASDKLPEYRKPKPLEGAALAKRDEAGELVPPVSTRLQVQPVAGGATIVVPSANVILGSIMLVAGVLFALFGLLFLVTVFLDKKFNVTAAMLTLPLVLLFLGLGFALVRGGLKALRRYELELKPGQLNVMQRGLFVVKRYGWTAEEVRGVKLIDRTFQMTDEPQRQIEIVTAGRGLRLMAGYSPVDVAFVLETLRDTLGIERGN